ARRPRCSARRSQTTPQTSATASGGTPWTSQIARTRPMWRSTSAPNAASSPPVAAATTAVAPTAPTVGSRTGTVAILRCAAAPVPDVRGPAASERRSSAGPVAELLQLLDRHQHRPGLRALGRPHDPPLLEQIHQPSRPGEADPQLPLQHRGRPELAAHDQQHGMDKQLVLVVTESTGARGVAGGVLVTRMHGLVVVDVRCLTLPDAHHLADLGLGDPGALQAARPGGAPV